MQKGDPSGWGGFDAATRDSDRGEATKENDRYARCDGLTGIHQLRN